MNENTVKSEMAAPRWAAPLGVLLAVVLVVQGVMLFKLWHNMSEPNAIRSRSVASASAEPEAESPPASDPVPAAADTQTVQFAQSAPAPSDRAGMPVGAHPFQRPPDHDPLAVFNEVWRGSDQGPWNPMAEFEHMRRQMDRLFVDSFGRFSLMPDAITTGVVPQAFAPRMDLEDRDGAYVVTLDVPGVEKHEIDVRIEDRLLTVSGKAEESTEHREGDQVLRKERRFGSFHRAVSLPGPVDDAGMEAACTNGVLVVTVPKKQAEKTGKAVHVK